MVHLVRSRRYAIALVAAAALTGSLAACGSAASKSSAGGGNSGNSGSTTPTTSGGGSASLGSGTGIHITEEDQFTAAPAGPMWQGIFNTYAKAHHITIKRTTVPGAIILTRELAQAGGGDLPNILWVDNENLGELASTGKIVPITSVCNMKLNDIDAAGIQAGTYDGKFYGLPLIENAPSLFYNKKMLAAAGVTPPKTWAQLIADAKKLSTSKHYGIALPAQNSPGTATDNFEAFLWPNGGSLTDLTAPSAVEALTVWATLVKDGSASKDSINWQTSNTAAELDAGKAAMAISGTWEIPTMEQTKGLQLGNEPIPAPKAGLPDSKLTMPLGGDDWALAKSTPAKEAAACRVLQYMESDPIVVKNAVTNWEVPFIKSAQAAAKAKQGPLMASLYAVLPYAKSRPESLGTSPALEAKYPTVDSDAGAAVTAALSGQQSPAGALASAATQIKSYLGQ